jgi:Ras-related protein Rab-6A
MSKLNSVGKSKWCFVTVGDYAVGKTSLIKSITDNPFNAKELTTVGMDPFQTTIHHQNTSIELVMWDTAGQERFKSLIPVYSRRSDAALIVFDMTNRQSFDSLDEKLEIFVKASGLKRLAFLVAAKCDLVDTFEVEKEEVISWARSNDLPFFFTSAKTGEGIHEFKQYLGEVLSKSLPGLQSSTDEVALPSSESEAGAQNPKKCCG